MIKFPFGKMNKFENHNVNAVSKKGFFIFFLL